MAVYIMTDSEQRLADILWEVCPIPRGQLVQVCWERLEWKKSTTYTVLRKICQMGIFQNINTIVSPCMSREDYNCKKGEKYLEENYQGSLPAFVAAYMERRKLSAKDVKALEALLATRQKRK